MNTGLRICRLLFSISFQLRLTRQVCTNFVARPPLNVSIGWTACWMILALYHCSTAVLDKCNLRSSGLAWIGHVYLTHPNFNPYSTTVNSFVELVMYCPWCYICIWEINTPLTGCVMEWAMQWNGQTSTIFSKVGCFLYSTVSWQQLDRWSRLSLTPALTVLLACWDSFNVPHAATSHRCNIKL